MIPVLFLDAARPLQLRAEGLLRRLVADHGPEASTTALRALETQVVAAAGAPSGTAATSTVLNAVLSDPRHDLLCRIQRRDLPGQIVIPGPRGELVHADRHTYPKGVHATAAVRPTWAIPADLRCSARDLYRCGGRRLAAYDSAVSSSLTVRPARVEDVAEMRA